ncbi:flagellar export protein FliJ [Rhodobacteraceae bacterium RKSG542]|uniref:FliH/SctL family protein n=1 Tax=Pseudovibrio flavus TaxID=2529854 RepID=UPI0012BC2B83|nr:FliH/SctL family protein [Pseudovibrio flavus]MTI18978.1 flagellar export protein FliJ [Pseudovibrio flavus]
MVTVLQRGAVSQRFLFDGFGSAPEAEQEETAPAVVEVAEPTITVAEHEALLAVARAQAMEEGRQQGIAQAQDQTQQQLQAQAQVIGASLQHIISTMDQTQVEQEHRQVALCFLIARRLCAHLIKREPLAEVVALLSECLTPLRKAVQVRIEVPEQDKEALDELLAPMIQQHAFEGRIHLVGVEDLERGDCRIEWPEGGIIRNQKDTVRQIEKVIESHFAARTSAKGAGEGSALNKENRP